MIALLAGNVLPLTPVLILWMNMATSATLSFGRRLKPVRKICGGRRAIRIHVMDGFAIWRVAFVGSMIAVSAFILEAAAAARLFAGVYPYRAVADSGHRPVVLYAELPRIGWILVNQRSAGQQDLDRQRRTAAAAAADYLRAFYADAVRHHRAAVPLLVITFIIGFAMFLIVELENR